MSDQAGHAPCRIVHYRRDRHAHWGVLRGQSISRLDCGLDDLLRLDRADAREIIDGARSADEPLSEVGLLAPVDHQEVWAAGVTYERSRDGRVAESGEQRLYDNVYRDPRPELFFKSTPQRVVAVDEAIGIRSDSSWDVPEPEVGVVFSPRLEVFGFTIGNDVTSRSIEGENPLYLPQAKIYDRACALGPGITPAWELTTDQFMIELTIERAGQRVFHDRTDSGRLRRSYEGLGHWIGRAMTFPHGVVLLTGTGIVPDAAFSLQTGDSVTIDISQLGTLSNPVVTVGSSDRPPRTGLQSRG